jgi:hypothetical protein
VCVAEHDDVGVRRCCEPLTARDRPTLEQV